MYLKSIEIQGFKSFANKILFEFHNGITGIVGPNGSGKSNVADAVRWVLGEQRSKQLRGGTMQDVIFAGTELRKPQGFAYVAITFDNSDHKLPIEYDEVTVSRRLYRSGESEYKINGTGCRLKDINELFFDTGIGKEGYSIIGQGQIDRILSGRPEERRELFDEAAGIVKFKRRKAIAQKKLEDEKQNLIRVTDILSELEKQVGPLKKQSEEAKEYLRLREELRCLDANLFLSESEELKSQIREIEKKENILTDDQENVRTESDKLKSEYETLGAEIDALDAAIDEEKNAGSRADLERQEKAGRIDVLREQIRTEQMNEEHIRSRMSSIDDELFKKEKEKSAYEDEKKTLEEALQEVEKEHSDTEAIVRNMDESVRNTEESIEKAKAEIIDILNQKADLAARRQRHETMLEQADVRRAQATQKLLKFKSDESVQEEQKKEQTRKMEKYLSKNLVVRLKKSARMVGADSSTTANTSPITSTTDATRFSAVWLCGARPQTFWYFLRSSFLYFSGYACAPGASISDASASDASNRARARMASKTASSMDLFILTIPLREHLYELFLRPYGTHADVFRRNVQDFGDFPLLAAVEVLQLADRAVIVRQGADAPHKSVVPLFGEKRVHG